MVILDARLHVLELVQDGEHVDEFAESEQIGLAHELLLLLRVTQTSHLGTEGPNGLVLGIKQLKPRYGKRHWTNGHLPGTS